MAKTSLPQIAAFPPATIRVKLGQRDWESSLDAWNNLTELHLRRSVREFALASANDDSLIEFLLSYISENLPSDRQISGELDQKYKALRRNTFLLCHRFLSEVDSIPQPLFRWRFLAQLSAVYSGCKPLRDLLDYLWDKRRKQLELELLDFKSQLLQDLTSSRRGLQPSLDGLLGSLGWWFGASPENARVFLDGSEIVDGLASVYANLSPGSRRRAIKVAYLGLVSLKTRRRPNRSLLLDHVYSLKSSADTQRISTATSATMMDDLISDTPLLDQLEEMAEESDAGRARSLLASLGSLESASKRYDRKGSRQKGVKGSKALGKQPAMEDYEQSIYDDMHVHRMSKVSQIQDLFPDLGSGFVVKLLDEYNDDAETVTAHLLEDSLPAHLGGADRAEELGSTSRKLEIRRELSPRPSATFVPERRNVYNNDEFDKLAVHESRLHRGLRGGSETADRLLDDRSSAPNKAAILSALAAFDLDDDEHDDTYDMADVGGTVDAQASSTQDEGNAPLGDRHEEILFSAYKQSPDVFARDAITRRGPARAALREQTRMTNEAIEGWGLTLSRDTRAQRKLDARYSGLSALHQPELKPTSWRASHEAHDSHSEDDEATDTDHAAGTSQRSGHPRGIGGFGRGRGRGRRGDHGGGGPGSHTSNQASEGAAGGTGTNDSTQQRTRQRKEANKGSRANHSRRDQRAKKMARGMG